MPAAFTHMYCAINKKHPLYMIYADVAKFYGLLVQLNFT